jgi:bacteriochlorophyllide d C-8(2)-methyltransferase
MRILLYSPDNGVTRNFMPHLWMFLLQALTPPGHEVLLIDGNAQPMDETQLAQFVRDQKIGLVGIGAMTRMVAKAYRMADAIRAMGVPVVMGGPHVTEESDEAHVMPTPSPWEKPMRPGRKSWRMLFAAS